MRTQRVSLGGRVAKAGSGAPGNKGEKEVPQVRGLKKPKGKEKRKSKAREDVPRGRKHPRREGMGRKTVSFRTLRPQKKNTNACPLTQVSCAKIQIASYTHPVLP